MLDFYTYICYNNVVGSLYKTSFLNEEEAACRPTARIAQRESDPPAKREDRGSTPRTGQKEFARGDRGSRACYIRIL